MKAEYREKVLTVIESSNHRLDILSKMLNNEMQPDTNEAIRMVNELKRAVQIIEDIVSIS
jgi:hypothetical protein